MAADSQYTDSPSDQPPAGKPGACADGKADGGSGSLSRTLDRSLGAFFRDGVRVSVNRPGQAWQFMLTVWRQAAAARRRARWARQGLRVPPILIFSITSRCNLRCAGCYAQSFLAPAEPQPPEPAAPPDAPGSADAARELSDARLDSICDEAAGLGVSFFVIAGGEPLLRPRILDIAGRLPRALFLLLTNGTLLDGQTAARLRQLPNVVPMLSLEGDSAQTDARRGPGTYLLLQEAMARLRRQGTFFGCSLTLTSRNFATVLADPYAAELVTAGCRFFLLLDYTPTDEATGDWVLTAEQRGQVAVRMAALKRRHRALFIAVPWDELAVGGCLAGGRGFVHVNAAGDLEPCPFAPYSDTNLQTTPLADALRSPFLARLRARPELLRYSGGGCALWKHRQQVAQVLAEAEGDAPQP